jgi:fumarate hydratase class II
MHYRKEQDSMGTVLIPEDVYYGPQTQRAVENFPFSSLRFPSAFIKALAFIKKHAARVNMELGSIAPELGEAIIAAAQEIIDGKFDDQFVVDIFQTGSGTSTNMNANEVIASRANEIITGKKGGKSPVHPNDHVNASQSSNDVIPSAIHIAALISMKKELVPSFVLLHKSLQKKSKEFADIIKIGRTHLQDAVPITLGQEFSGYARQIEAGIGRIKGLEGRLSELALGGTAVGNGLNAPPEFAPRVISLISQETNCVFQEARNHFEAHLLFNLVLLLCPVK